MRSDIATVLIAVLTWAGASSLPGQERGPSRDADGPRAGERQPGGGPPGFARPSFPLQTALDTDGNGKISEAEMRVAAESLKKLDKDGDGKLSAEEIGWPPRFGRMGPGGGRRDPFGGPPGGDRAAGGRGFAERLMARDANQDGKVTRDELPKSMQFLLVQGDQDKDGAIDEKEARALADRISPAASRAEAK